MQDFQQRVVDEREDLDLKLSKLVSFIPSAAFRSLHHSDQELLRAQASIMLEYSGILTHRIARF